MLEDLYKEMEWPVSGDHETQTSQMQLWQSLSEELQSAPLGLEVKSSRWFSLETFGRSVCNRWWRVLLTLIHLGCLRKWWKLGHCPLFSSNPQSFDNGDPIGGVDGALQKPQYKQGPECTLAVCSIDVFWVLSRFEKLICLLGSRGFGKEFAAFSSLTEQGDSKESLEQLLLGGLGETTCHCWGQVAVILFDFPSLVGPLPRD